MSTLPHGPIARPTGVDARQMPTGKTPPGTTPRVIRNTMAAESAAIPKSMDRQLRLRLVIGTLLYEQPELKGKDWRTRLRIPGILVTDAKSLYDYLVKEGSMPVERQTFIDVLLAKDLVEQK